MFKRVTIVALLVVAAFLVLAIPALAFNGYRGDYTTSGACMSCHDGIQGIPAVYHDWSTTKHGIDEEADSAARSLPYGSVCAGCHTSNYDPSKVTPVPTATSATGAVSWAASPSATTQPQADGNAPFSENNIGCSSCHYGAKVTGDLVSAGVDSNDSAHKVPYGNMADAQICGACHSRYAYTTNTYTVEPVPYLTVTLPLPGTPVTPNPSATSLIQPQMAIGYPMLGSPSTSPAWSPSLAAFLNVPTPGWTPTPSATSAGLGKLQTHWTIDGEVSPWQQTGHDGSASQYPEWASEGLGASHADALTKLQAIGMGNNPTCLECHSADYRIMKEAGKSTANYTPKFGITCVGCHTPHEAGQAKGVWDEEFDTQLVGDPKNPSDLCTSCHNGELPEGSTASPGAEIHHPMKEMMDGYGAIDVASFPSVHKGKCVQCHMPPTSVSRGSVQLGGNHTFNVITPKDATDASPIPYATATAVATATPTPNGTPVITTTLTVTQDGMPFSACSTCHNKTDAVKHNPQPVSTTIATPNPAASPLKVNVTVTQNANQTAVGNMNGGDKALWLQDTIEQRQAWTKARIADIWAVLDQAAVNMGFKDHAAAQKALVAIPAAQRTTAENAFLMAFTNNEFVDSEGSYGLHNWDYSREIVNKAMEQAKTAATGVTVKLPWKVTLNVDKTSIKSGTTVTYSGTVKTAKGVNGAGTVKVLKRINGVWHTWKSTTVKADGTYSLKVKMTSKGTFYFRALMPGDATNSKAYSTPNRKLVVK